MENLHRRLQGSWRDVFFGGIAVLVIIADQLTKWWIRSSIALGDVLVDKGFVQIIRIENSGASFGILRGHTSLIIAAVFVEMVIILAAVYLLRKRLSFLDSMPMRIGAGLIFGGAIGNQVDRLVFGSVTDFVDFKVWPAFNVADASAVVGTIIVVYCIIFLSGIGKRKA
ncbi:MAG: signal peptidase II [Dehalococcoidales bacterium]|jgi:signal peptidase II